MFVIRGGTVSNYSEDGSTWRRTVPIADIVAVDLFCDRLLYICVNMSFISFLSIGYLERK